jgi:hypothetical protein
MPFNNLTKAPPNRALESEGTTDNYVEVLEARIWGFVVVVVTMILAFIVIALLYSVTFVTQPIKSMAPIDQAYTKMLNDIVLLIVGGIGGVISKRAVGSVAKSMAPEPPKFPAAAVAQPQPQTPPGPTSVVPDWNWMGYKNPELDESWTPGPPPTTPPDYVDPAKAEIAAERAAAREEA